MPETHNKTIHTSFIYTCLIFVYRNHFFTSNPSDNYLSLITTLASAKQLSIETNISNIYPICTAGLLRLANVNFQFAMDMLLLLNQ